MSEASKSPVSSVLSSELHSSPRTPGPPIALPRRCSSLAFSSRWPTQFAEPADSLSVAAVTMGDHDTTRSNISRKRPTFSTPTLERVHPGHVVEMQKVFQTAQATLHQDIQAAISPVGSIEARMKLHSVTPLSRVHALSPQSPGSRESTKAWRYSMAPELLAVNTIDVREPFPSPALPSPLIASPPWSTDKEPMSSGFSTPHAAIPTEEIVAAESEDMDQQVAELDRPLQQLSMGGDEQSDTASRVDCPSTRNPSCASITSSMEVGWSHSPKGGIILPEMAEAAAHSARAKRRVLREEFLMTDDGSEDVVVCPEPRLHALGAVLCPDPTVHQSPSTSEYDGMMSYHYLHTPALVPRPTSIYSYGESYPAEYAHMPGTRSGPEGARATATGSPMPFTRGIRNLDASDECSSPVPHHSQRSGRTMLLERHFQPGWYRAKDQSQPPTARGAYSFSTAAAKVREEDQAPDQRMRDSYKTDTLTALPESRARYRRNGIGATVLPRNVDRHYQRRPQSRPRSSGRRSDSRHAYHRASDVRFRSSLPRAVPETRVLVQRKRAADDNFKVAEGRIADLRIDPALQLRPSDEVIKLDDQTKAAVRMSIFGASTPEALHNARQGIRELSPNVQIYRRDHPRSRKKRRPSYWDQDLRDVRASPAGRGGIESPASAKRSLTAEVEVASTNSGDASSQDASHGDTSHAKGEQDQENVALPGTMVGKTNE